MRFQRSANLYRSTSLSVWRRNSECQMCGDMVCLGCHSRIPRFPLTRYARGPTMHNSILARAQNELRKHDWDWAAEARSLRVGMTWLARVARGFRRKDTVNPGTC